MLYSELASRKGLKSSLDPEALKAMLDCDNMRMFFIKHEGNIITGNVIYVNSDRSYDIYAANSDESIRNGATRYIIQSIIEKLKQEGVKEFDFGRIPPSNGASDGVYKFKNSIVGKKIQYNGEWSYYRKPAKELIMHLGRQIFTKKSRY
jgi:lipid II:glycine glycyltransferase (peptidoglycan interpeptide bridge formation enzyme)